MKFFRILGIAFALVLCQGISAGAGERIPETIEIPQGSFISGSGPAEREAAYRLDEAAYGHSRTREWGWYDSERKRGKINTGRYRITKTLITNAQYQVFVLETEHRVPDVDEDAWNSYGLLHPYKRTRRHVWKNGVPPDGRFDHPVVMVSHADARAYGEWLSKKTDKIWRLPSETEWEKAARGTDGRWFPWGNSYDPKRLNSHDLGPFDTVPVGRFPDGESPFGLVDPAGQVFEWTSTDAKKGRFLVKGGSWDDRGCGICRPAARHSRPENLKHILIGFRLVRLD